MRNFFKSTSYAFRIILSLALFLVAVPLILYFSYLFGHKVLEGGVAGGDTAYHFAWIHTLQRFFPKIPMWFPFAGGGQSIILGYWVLPYYLAIVGSFVSSLSVEQWVFLLEFLSVPIISLEIYIYLWVRFKNQVMATLGGLMYPLSAVSWGWIAGAGFYAMQLSTATLLPPFLFFDLYIEEELTHPEKVGRKRLFLLGFCLTFPLTILMHGSAMPNLLLGLPLYTILRSQLLPRRSENRFLSLLRSLKALTVCLILGLATSSFFFIPQMRYFSFQAQGQGFAYGADMVQLPLKGLLGFERYNPELVGSLHQSLFFSQLVVVFGGVGILFALLKRNFLSALGITALFYIWWITSTHFIQKNLPFLSPFLTPTAERSVTVPAIYLTILAAYGLWSVADIPGTFVRFLGKLLGKLGKVGKIFEYGFVKLFLVISSLLVIPLSIWAFYDFRARQSYQTETISKGEAVYLSRAYYGYGSVNFSVPFCMFPGWDKEVSRQQCNEIKPQYSLGGPKIDLIGEDFEERVVNLDLGKLTRVSISPNIGGFAFSFNDHSQASMVQTPSSQATPIFDWLGYHNGILFLKAEEPPPKEVAEVAKWFGVRYVFLNPTSDESIFYRYPEEIWPVAPANPGPLVIEFIESPGLSSFSTKPAVLMIGSREKKAYTNFFRVATKGGILYDEAILIQGSENVDDYSLEELKKFNTLVAFGYSYKNQKKAWNLLKKYVEDGGVLFIDTGWQYVAKDWGKGPDRNGKFIDIRLPDVFPVAKTFWGDVGMSWSGSNLATDIAKNIDLEKFGTPIWGDKAWGMAMASKKDIRPWAEAVLTSGDKVIIAKGSFGKGKVVWSGMNLFNHAYGKTSTEEYRFTGNIFEYLLPKDKAEEGDIAVDWEFPDEIKISFSKVPSKPAFLYWAESYTPDWKAYLVKGGKTRKLTIYRAGPGFKAVRLEGLDGSEKLIFRYSLRNVLIFSTGITFLTIIVLLTSIFDAVFFKRSLEKKVIKFIFKKESFGFENMGSAVKKRFAKPMRWLSEEE